MTDAIDMKHLSLYVGEDEMLRNEILSIYRDQLEKWVTVLDEADAATMPDNEWHHAVHALKGASRGVGVWAIGDLAETAEGFVGGVIDKADRRAALVNSLKVLTEDVLQQIGTLLDAKAA